MRCSAGRLCASGALQNETLCAPMHTWRAALHGRVGWRKAGDSLLELLSVLHNPMLLLSCFLALQALHCLMPSLGSAICQNPGRAHVACRGECMAVCAAMTLCHTYPCTVSRLQRAISGHFYVLKDQPRHTWSRVRERAHRSVLPGHSG